MTKRILPNTSILKSIGDMNMWELVKPGALLIADINKQSAVVEFVSKDADVVKVKYEGLSLDLSHVHVVIPPSLVKELQPQIDKQQRKDRISSMIADAKLRSEANAAVMSEYKSKRNQQKKAQ